MFVKPAPGRVVRYPGDPSRLLPESGADVPERDIFWRRRLAQGDVVAVTTETVTAKAAGDSTEVNEIQTGESDASAAPAGTSEVTAEEDKV